MFFGVRNNMFLTSAPNIHSTFGPLFFVSTWPSGWLAQSGRPWTWPCEEVCYLICCCFFILFVKGEAILIGGRGLIWALWAYPKASLSFQFDFGASVSIFPILPYEPYRALWGPSGPAHVAHGPRGGLVAFGRTLLSRQNQTTNLNYCRLRLHVLN